MLPEAQPIPPIPPTCWTVDEVCSWSYTHIVGKKYANPDFIQLLVDNDIDGSVLGDITEEHLEKHFKVRALGRRLKILGVIRRLLEQGEGLTSQEDTSTISSCKLPKQQTSPTFNPIRSTAGLGSSFEPESTQPKVPLPSQVPSNTSKPTQEPTQSPSQFSGGRTSHVQRESGAEKVPSHSSSTHHGNHTNHTNPTNKTLETSPTLQNLSISKDPNPSPSLDNRELNKILATFMSQNKAGASNQECATKEAQVPAVDLTSPTQELQKYPSIFERTSVETYFQSKYKGVYEVDENYLYDTLYHYRNKKPEIIRKLSQILEKYASSEDRVLSKDEAILVFIWEEFIHFSSSGTSNNPLPHLKKPVSFSQEFDVFYESYMTELQDHLYQRESLLETSGINSKNITSLTFVKSLEINKEIKTKRLLWKENIRKHILANGKCFADVKAKNLTINPFLCQVLKPHQVKGVEFLWENLVVKKNGCILAHSMGLGKTLQVIAFLFSLLEAITTNLDLVPCQLKDFKVLILCPLSVRSNWIIEFKKWIPDRHLINIPLFEVGDSVSGAFIDRVGDVKEWYSIGGILVMSYNYFRVLLESPESKTTDESGLSIESCLLSPGPSLVIADEGHIIKNPLAKITHFIKSLPTPYKVCLSGYPIQNNLMEYWCMVDFVYPDFLGSKLFFEETFAKPITEALYSNCPLFFKKFGHLKLYLLNIALKTIVHRLDSRLLINDLPTKTEVFISCKLSSQQQEMYLDCLDSLRCDPSLLDACFFFKGNLLTDVCNHPMLIKARIHETDTLSISSPSNLLDETKPSINISRIKHGLSKLKKKYSNNIISFDSESSSKFTILTAIINETLRLGEKMLVFSRSLSMLDLIEKYLNGQIPPILYFRLDGSVSGKDRQKMFDQFNCPTDEHVVFLISTTAGCLGANICGATRIVLYDVDWNPSYAEQAIARSFRYGQTSKTYVYRLYTCGTWEDALVKCGDFKRTLASRVVDQKEAPDNHSRVKKYFQKPPANFPKFVNQFGGHDPIVNRIASDYSDSLVEIFEAETVFGDIEYSLSDDIKERVLSLVAQEDREDEILPSEKVQMEFFDVSKRNQLDSSTDTTTMLAKSDNQTPTVIHVEDPLTETEDTCLPWQISYEPALINHSPVAEAVDYNTFFEDYSTGHSNGTDKPRVDLVDFDNYIDLCEDNQLDIHEAILDFQAHDSGSNSSEPSLIVKSTERKLSDDATVDVHGKEKLDIVKLLSPSANTLSAKILPIQIPSRPFLAPPRKTNVDKEVGSTFDCHTIPEIKKSVMLQDSQLNKSVHTKPPKDGSCSPRIRVLNNSGDLQRDKRTRTFSNQDNFNQRSYRDSRKSPVSLKSERVNFDQPKLLYKDNSAIPHFYLYSPERRRESNAKPTSSSRHYPADSKPSGSYNRYSQRYDDYRSRNSPELKSDSRSDRDRGYSRYESSSHHHSHSDRFKWYSSDYIRDHSSRRLPTPEKYNGGSADKSRQTGSRGSVSHNSPKHNIKSNHNHSKSTRSLTNTRTNSPSEHGKDVSRKETTNHQSVPQNPNGSTNSIPSSSKKNQNNQHHNNSNSKSNQKPQPKNHPKNQPDNRPKNQPDNRPKNQCSRPNKKQKLDHPDQHTKKDVKSEQQVD